MNSPIYYKDESAYLTDDHLRVLLGPNYTGETPESLRKNPERLEELYNLRKLQTHLDVQAVNDQLLLSQDEGDSQRKNLPIDDNNIDDSDVDGNDIDKDTFKYLALLPHEFPYFRHPGYFYYLELIQDGGRPAMPFGLFMQIWKDPGPEWRDIVAAWKDVLRCRESLPYRDRGDSLFGWQWRRWRLFRDWQYTKRNVMHGRFSSEVCSASWNRFCEFNFQKSVREIPARAYEPADELRIEMHFEFHRINDAINAFRKKHVTPSATTSVDTYFESVHRRLRRRGYSAKVQLRANPKHQDDLATWLEYVAFEIWHSDLHQEKSKTELHKIAFEFLATWALRQIPLVEEQTRAARDQKRPLERLLPVDEETFGFATKWGVHHQDPTVAIRDFAIPACRVPRDVALEHVLGVPASAPTVGTQTPGPTQGEQSKSAQASNGEKPPAPTIVLWEASSKASSHEQERDTALLAPPRLPRRRLKRRNSDIVQRDARYSKVRVVECDKTPSVEFQPAPLEPTAADDIPLVRPAGEVDAEPLEEKAATIGQVAMANHNTLEKDQERYVEDVLRGLRRSSRIRDKAAKNSRNKSEASIRRPIPKKRKLKKRHDDQ